MRVKIDKSRRHDELARVKNFRALRHRNFSRRSNLFDLLSVQQHVEARVRLRRRIDHPPVLNQKHSPIPSTSLAVPGACPSLWPMNSTSTRSPCELLLHWSSVPARKNAACPPLAAYYQSHG